MSNKVRRSKLSPVQQAAIDRRSHAGEPPKPRRRLPTGVVVAVVAAVLVVGGVAAIVKARSDTAPTVEPSEEAVAYGCVSCHSLSGRQSEGPTWKGLYGSEVQLQDGRTVTADDAYLRKAIEDPQAEIVDGYTSSVMPTRPIPEADVTKLIAFIRTLGDPGSD